MQFNGLNPGLLNGSKETLGLSQDPEGIAIARNGNYYVSDEYGPSVREFRRDGTLLRTFTPPENLIPKQTGGTVNYVDGRPTIVNGRQDNRGFEGLAISPDGTKLYAMLQDPLVNEGSSSDGRRSRNLRMVEFDVATGTQTRQLTYQLASIADINDRIPGTASDFGATNQCRSIGISAVVALNDHQFLVIERDNRGYGSDTTTDDAPVGSKRVYLIDITGASDVKAISFANTNDLPAGVVAVAKTLYLDIQAALVANGVIIPEKIEGLAIGPQLDDGSYLMLIGSDNDFSVTQTGAGVQFNVCRDGVYNGVANDTVALGDDCPAGLSLVANYLYAFRADFTRDGITYEVQQRIPEPATTSLLSLAALAMLSIWRRRY